MMEYEEVVEEWAPAVEVTGGLESAVNREQHEASAGCPVALRISSVPIVTVHRMFRTTPPSILPSLPERATRMPGRKQRVP